MMLNSIISYLYFQDLPREPFLPLTEEEEAMVERAFNSTRYALIHAPRRPPRGGRPPLSFLFSSFMGVFVTVTLMGGLLQAVSHS